MWEIESPKHLFPLLIWGHAISNVTGFYLHSVLRYSKLILVGAKASLRTGVFNTNLGYKVVDKVLFLR